MGKNRCAAIILAAGQGKRMGTKIQKQYLELNGKPVLYYSLAVFEKSTLIDEIILVVGADQEAYCRREIVDKYGFRKIKQIVEGGAERYHSVYHGLCSAVSYTHLDVYKRQGLSRTIKDYRKLSEELGVGEITLRDIVKELEKPARDPRDEMPKPILRTDVLEMKDLTPGMVLKGTVRNVIDFGVFVDIGVHQDGLVHISQITDKKFIKHPMEVVSVGDIVEVKVMSVDLEKKRIQLTMKGI